MVIGYNPTSKFATDLQAASNGSKPWYQVLEEPGLRLGRTDPALDPKGVRTLRIFSSRCPGSLSGHNGVKDGPPCRREYANC